MNLVSEIKSIARKNHKDIVEIRRHIHMNPELSFQEVKTGKYIMNFLKRHKIKHSGGWCKNGVVAIIKGEKKSSKTIALRADIDALPIKEANKVKYKSKNPNVMHACGHDAHTASLLGTILILNKCKAHFGGTIKCIFQPGEEKLPGGASILIKEGVLKNPKPKTILGQHVHPPLEVGKIGIRGGQYMASADEIYLTVNGKGGHAALPHECIDTVYIASRIISSLQEVISRRNNPLTPAVLSFGKINSIGGATNVIPDQVKIEGTFRTMDEKWRKKAHKMITTNATKTAQALGGSCEVDIKVGYPSLYNNEEYTSKINQSMITFMGARNVVSLPMRMTAEDFAWYSQEIPACFYRLGTGNRKKGITSPVHTPTFNIDEKSLEIGAGLMAYLAIESLSY